MHFLVGNEASHGKLFEIKKSRSGLGYVKNTFWVIIFVRMLVLFMFISSIARMSVDFTVSPISILISVLVTITASVSVLVTFKVTVTVSVTVIVTVSVSVLVSILLTVQICFCFCSVTVTVSFLVAVFQLSYHNFPYLFTF